MTEFISGEQVRFQRTNVPNNFVYRPFMSEFSLVKRWNAYSTLYVNKLNCQKRVKETKDK